MLQEAIRQISFVRIAIVCCFFGIALLAGACETMPEGVGPSEGDEGVTDGSPESGDEAEAPAVLPEECLVPATARVSVDNSGAEGNGNCSTAAISREGRFVAFASDAPDLVPGDGNAASDVFVHDRETGITTRVSVDSDGNEANGSSTMADISADGRYVAFASDAPDLVPGDANAASDVFVHDRQTGDTIRVSIDSNGVEGNMGSFSPAISADGRFTAFESNATNLDLIVADANGVADIFVHDMQTGDTERVSFQPGGAEWGAACFGADINADSSGVVDGNFVSYSVTVGNGVHLFDRGAGITEKISLDSDENEGNGDSEHAAISGDGRFVAFRTTSDDMDLLQMDNNGVADIFVRDRQAGTTVRVSLNSNGVEGNGFSAEPAISDDGRYVGFQSESDNLDLVTADNNARRDFFVHDTQTGTTERISLDENGNEGQGDTIPVGLGFGEDGRFVVFLSEAPDLAPMDGNAAVDVFVRARCQE
ncbi:MAG: hypothetical protein MI923_12215 [Phycisphaerales bacterium]|nr:hypothetical protein [Phycisphaerales bacterium]